MRVMYGAVRPENGNATYADLAALPEHQVGEIVGGDLHVSPRPAARHARAASRLGGHLVPAFDDRLGRPGGWIILDEPELHLGPDVLVPDLVGWQRERFPEISGDPPFFTLIPDWICEVLSPSTEALDRTVKMPVYAREGVRHLWFLNPLSRSLEVYRLAGRSFCLLSTLCGDIRVQAEPFEELELDLASLWAW